MLKTNTQLVIKKKECYLCVNNLKDIDFRNTQALQKFVSSYNKIVPKKRSGLCAKHQRQVARAIKRARIMGLIPFIPR